MIVQLKSQLRVFVIVFVIALAVLGILFGLHFNKEVPFKLLTNDIAVSGNLPVYAGFLSQLGIFLWCATAGICLYTNQFIFDKTIKKFIIFSSGITIMLAFDDTFMFHEIVFPSLGVHQKIVFLIYGLIVLFYLFKFRKVILETNFVILFFAFGCFALSLFIDNFLHEASPLVNKLGEDFFKFLGILFWISYFSVSCRQFQNGDLETT